MASLVYREDWARLYCGDCLEGMRGLPGESVDLLATDPPYGIGFMGKDWDRALPDKRVWVECLRVLKPGSFAFVMCIPRADCLSRMIISLEDAGFWVNFTPIFWAMASGFPKAQNCAKAILKKFLQASLQDVSHSPYIDEDSQCDSHCRFCGGLLQSGLVIFRDVSPLQGDALKYSRLFSPSVDIQADSEHTYKASLALLSFHHATQDLKPLAFWQTIVSSVLQSKPDDWLPQFSADNWGLGDKFPLPHDYGQRDSILGNNNDECGNGIGVQPKPDKFEMAGGNIRKSTQSYLYYNRYCPDCQRQMSSEYSKLVGSFSGFQPKPAVEVILVAMKPLSEKAFVDQALKNGKGITWLDDGRVPYKGEEKVVPFQYKHSPEGYGYRDRPRGGYGGMKIGMGKPEEHQEYDGERECNPQGRFPANLLCSDDALNDGRISKSSGGKSGHTGAYGGGYKEEYYGGAKPGLGDSGSFSRYFDLDAWWEKRVETLPESVKKTFPFLIVPKASKGEKNRGCEGLPEKLPRAYRTEANGTSDRPSKGMERFQGLPVKNTHPTCKPVKLMAYLITLGSRQGDLVLDPFIGSGTTGIAAKVLGRRCLGYEIDEGYCRIAAARLKSVGQRVML